MERATRAFSHIASRVARLGAGYLGVNVLLLAAEAKWHVVSRLTIWDVREMKTLAYLVSETTRVTEQLHHLH